MNEKRGTGCDYDNGIYHLTQHSVTGIQIMIATVKKNFRSDDFNNIHQKLVPLLIHLGYD